jgi:hypothetical protein
MRRPSSLSPWFTVEQLAAWVKEAPDKTANQRRLAIWLTHAGPFAAHCVADLLAVSTQAVWKWVPDEYCVMFLDGAGWHKAHELTVPANMKLLPPPPYSPELNLAEHVWEYIRENDIRNQIFNTLDEIMDTIETSLRHLHEAPEELRSMTAFPWIFEKAA